MSKAIVIIIFSVALLALGGWDLWLYLDGKEGNTITQIIRWLSSHSALFPWLGGFVMGFLTSHFWEGISYGPKRILRMFKL